MTEQQMIKFAEIVASKVVEQLEQKQKEWDESFIKSQQDLFTSDNTADIKFLSEEEFIELRIKDLENKLNEALEEEDYELAANIKKEISKLNKSNE
jgi:excinuclease UvrABC helicase subunit UvrB